jgi:hypothetical protein
MNESTGKPGLWSGAILAVMLVSAWISAGSDIQRRFVSTGAVEATRRFVNTDQMLAEVGRAGPVGLQFINCDGGTRQFIYSRAVYDLYPLPVLIVDKDAVVNIALQIPSGKTHSENWWLRRGVKTVVTVDGSTNRWKAESLPTTNPSAPG